MIYQRRNRRSSSAGLRQIRGPVRVVRGVTSQHGNGALNEDGNKYTKLYNQARMSLNSALNPLLLMEVNGRGVDPGSLPLGPTELINCSGLVILVAALESAPKEREIG